MAVDESTSAAQLKEFLETLDDFAPTIPDELVQYYLQQAGFTTSDPRILRMVSLAAHKFVLDVLHDTMQYQRIRAQSTAASAAGTAPSSSSSSTRPVLSMEDLAASLKEYGVNVCKPEYYSDVANDKVL